MSGRCPDGRDHQFRHISGGTQWSCERCGKLAILPQPGPQSVFLTSKADIAIYGGAAGGGKTHALLMQPLRHIRNGGFGAVIFRRTNPQIVAQGGIWDQSHDLYSHAGGTPYYGQQKQWVFKSGAKVTFSHMESEEAKKSWDSAQIPLIEFDEATSFSESQFVYMLSRNRSTCGVNPYIRAACNPDSDSWVAKWVDWWIDQDSGYPIAERSGVLRWFVRDGDAMVWFGSKPEAVAWILKNWDVASSARMAQVPVEQFVERLPKSFTFVPALLDDNRILDSINPQYRASLMAMPQVERERLLRGNWKIRPAAGLKFPRDKWVLADAAPPKHQFARLVRFWDSAYTEGGKGARTAGVLMGELRQDAGANLRLPTFWVLDARCGRWGDAERESQIKATAELDRREYGHVVVGIEEEGGAGKFTARHLLRTLAGHSAYAEHPTAKKHLRWTPLATQQQIGNVAILQGSWDWHDYIRELDALAGDESLDKSKLKDLADASAGAFKYLTSGGGVIRDALIASGGEDDASGELTDDERRDFDPDLLEIIDGSKFDDADDDWQ